MSKKRIVIIGGGIAGLTSGIFAQKNGFESVILEKHHTLGGECTGWDRSGYHIDGCIHWLVGTREGTGIRRLWDEVGALDSVEIHEPDSFMAVEHEGRTVNFYRDLERMRQSWTELSPEDSKAIDELCRDIARLHSFELPVGKPVDMMNILEKLRFLISVKDVAAVMQKYSRISASELAGRFRHPALSAAINSFMPEEGYSAMSIVFPLGTFTGGNSSIPMGGSRALALRMAEKYRTLGGEVKPLCEVESLEIRDGKVVAAISKSGTAFSGDYFVAACDASALFDGMLKGEYGDPEYERRFADPDAYPLASNIYVGIGYEGRMDHIPRSLKFPVSGTGINSGGKPIEHIQLTHYGYEPGFAPEGHTVMTVAINQFAPELEFWQGLYHDREAYRFEKERIGYAVLSALQARFPEMEGKLTLLDVATPATYTRYCNAYKGAFMAFWPTLRGKQLNHTGRIKGLGNLWLSGQWLQPPGGLPNALITGKQTTMRICRQDGKRFN